jgi:hypothetical protein
LLGTYRRPKMPTIDAITYSKPAILPGFLVKRIVLPGSLRLRYGNGCPMVPKGEA